MDGENNGSKPYEQMDDLGGFMKPPILGSTPISPKSFTTSKQFQKNPLTR